MMMNSWGPSGKKQLFVAMQQAEEAVAEVSEDPRNTRSAFLNRQSSILKALDDVGTPLRQPMWQMRAAGNGGLDTTRFSQQFASLPRARLGRPSSDGSFKKSKVFSQSSGTIARSASSADGPSFIQESLRWSEEAVRETELDPRNKRPPALSRKDSVLHAMKHLNISLEDLHDKDVMHDGPLKRVMSNSMKNIRPRLEPGAAEPHSNSFMQLDKLAASKVGLWGSMKRVPDLRAGGSGKRLVGVTASAGVPTAHPDQVVTNMLPAALGIFRDVTRVMEALCAAMDSVNTRIEALARSVDALKKGRGGVGGIEASVAALEQKLLGEGARGAAVGGGAGGGWGILQAAGPVLRCCRGWTSGCVLWRSWWRLGTDVPPEPELS